ncbi:hypothetical protein OO014_06840 [Intrasporangium calvum]|uniref:Uncharacterized protein n=1 Tax=Intrasporangium calvum TaxID=53358 RepID=A0ABT5GFD5_9MICO|nr:hypothetical protein [Intrasporangium calvum]MDC5696972.1 hypothetical protein [Intrasporangium calvum]
MRTGKSLVLARMLLRFFLRRVARTGVLRSRPVKVLAVGTVALILGAGAVAAYFFLEPMVAQEKVWGLLFEMSTVSVVLWVQIAFLLVKVLFLNAAGMLELSFQLPLTNRERAAALLVYEATMAGIVSAVGFTSLTVAAVVLLGPAAVPRLLEAIVFPIILTYLALSVGYLLLARVLVWLGLRRIQGIVLILVLFSLLMLYASGLGSLSSAASAAYLADRTDFVWVASLAWITHHYGPVAMVSVFLVTAALLTALALWATPSQHVPHSRYLNLPFDWPLVRRLSAYDRCLLRSSQAWLAMVVSAAVFVGLCLDPVVNPLWALAVLSMSGLYQFAATEPLRMLSAQRGTAWRTYGRLVRAQLLLLAGMALPCVAVLAAARPDQLGGSLFALGGCVAGALVAISIGIAFPAEHDNPFSVFVGLAVASAVLGLLGIALGILQMPQILVVLIVAASLAIIVWYSVQGIRTFDSRRRNEKGAATREQHRGGSAVDPRGRSGSASLSHVLDS